MDRELIKAYRAGNRSRRDVRITAGRIAAGRIAVGAAAAATHVAAEPPIRPETSREGTRSVEASPHLLLVDDDREIRDLLTRFLTQHGYRVTAARDGRDMRHAIESSRIDLVMLDVMLPGSDGFALCRELRANSKVPIIMVTAVGSETDRIVGLEMGADDYIAKPFNPRELLARIKAVMRRSDTALGRPGSGAQGEFRFSGWKLETGTRQLKSPDGTSVPLTTGEFDLLIAFVEHPQRMLTREQLLDLARGRGAAPFDRSIDVQVSRLRRKLEPNSKAPQLIKTVRGGGYQFTAQVERK